VVESDHLELAVELVNYGTDHLVELPGVLTIGVGELVEVTSGFPVSGEECLARLV